MNQFSPSEAALEGFRMTRERPGTILAWAGIYFLGILAIAAIMMIALGPDFIEIVKRGQFNQADAEAVTQMLEASWPAFFLLLLVVVTLMSVLTAGIYRLVLRPGEPGFAHLRFGPDELRLTAVNLFLFPIGFLCLVGGIAALTMVRATASPLSLVLLLAVISLTAWVGARLSMVTPMTFALGKISFGEAWALTRGRFWSLLGMMLLAAIFYVIIWLLISIIGIAIVTVAGGGAEAIEHGQITPGGIIAALATLVMQFLLSVLQIVMIYAPFAVAYQQLHGDPAVARKA